MPGLDQQRCHQPCSWISWARTERLFRNKRAIRVPRRIVGLGHASDACNDKADLGRRAFLGCKTCKTGKV